MKIKYSYDKDHALIAMYGKSSLMVSHGHMNLKKKRLWVPLLMICWGRNIKDNKEAFDRFCVLFKIMFGGPSKFVTENATNDDKERVSTTTVYGRNSLSFKRKMSLVERTGALISITELGKDMEHIIIYATMKVSRKRLEEYKQGMTNR